jgi:hypothetical protein
MLTRIISFILQYKRLLALLAAILCLLGLVYRDRVAKDQAAQKTLHDAEKYKNEPTQMASPRKALESKAP